jgi:hypothetical protein
LTLIYGKYSDELERVRYFRNNILRKTPVGQEIIRLYYQWSPLVLKTMEEDEGFKEEVTEIADGVLEMIGGVK